MYRYSNVSSTLLESGDVYARAKMRSLEVEQSIEFILEQLENLPTPKPKDREKNLRPNAIIVSLIEGHRGEIAHVLLTDVSGKLSRVNLTSFRLRKTRKRMRSLMFFGLHLSPCGRLCE